MSRQDRRRDMSVDARVTLLEGDLDDQAVDLERLADSLDGIRRLMFGILASTTTASVLLAINLVVRP